MSQLTDFGENKLVDFIRGQGLTLPSSWFFALGSAASDSAFTEIVCTGYARTAVVRSTANFNNTQGDGTGAVSSGTSHATANTGSISFGSPSGGVVTASYIGVFDASTSGNCWMWLPLDTVISVGGSAPVAIAAGIFSVMVGPAGSGCSDYLANKLVDLLFRAVAFTWPATLYLAAYTAAPTNAGGGTEVAAADYSRTSLVPALATLSGTQAAGSTTASTGTGGVTSNNSTINFPTPTSAWGTVVAGAVRDAATLGNLLWWGMLGSPKTVSVGAPLSFSAAAFSITVA